MRTPQTGRESDLGLVRGAARRLGLQSAALVALAVIVLVSISTVLVLRQQNASAEAFCCRSTRTVLIDTRTITARATRAADWRPSRRAAPRTRPRSLSRPVCGVLMSSRAGSQDHERS